MSNRKLFYGTMNASKSAQLLMQVYNLERQGKTFIIFKPEIDTRDKSVIRSRALEESRPAISIEKNKVGKMFIEAYKQRPDFIFADEIQFMSPEQIVELSDISINLNIPIFAYGLLLSYTGELFEGSKKAIECGFTLHELKMQCDFCNEKSTHHLLYINDKLIKDGQHIYIGDENYKSCCYKCYIKKIYNS